MLESSLATRFVEQIATYTEYNVNIMNEKGVIIASRDQDRVGSFHETAYNLIRDRREIAVVDEDNLYLGVHKGVNLLVVSEGEPVGVVGVTGDPEQVRGIALIIKMALETMIHYETEREQLFRQKSVHELFYFALFNEPEPSRERLREYAEKLSFDVERVRIPALLVYDAPVDTAQILGQLQQGLCGAQDMCWAPNDRHILIFKALPPHPQEAFSQFRGILGAWLEQMIPAAGCQRVLVGTMQCRLHYYHQGLSCCQWLEQQCPLSDTAVLFYDHIDDYVTDLLPMAQLHGIYNVFDHGLDADTKSGLTRLVGALRHNNYNLAQSSQELYIHKNTMAFRMNKVRALFGIDPLQRESDRTFLNFLGYYLQQKE